MTYPLQYIFFWFKLFKSNLRKVGYLDVRKLMHVIIVRIIVIIIVTCIFYLFT